MSQRKAAPYLYYGQTTSLCEACLELVPTKILLRDGSVWYQKRCKEHGVQSTRVSSDVDYWLQSRTFLKPGDRPLTTQTETSAGCPHDCGLCPDHEQHSCVALVEITDACNIECPVCFAGSSPGNTGHRSLAQIAHMLDAIVASEGEPDVVQISGGEPTIHPQILEVLQLAKRKPIKHLMLNTNGIRIAQDKAFVEQLADLMPAFEVYLQFDTLNNQSLKAMRGSTLADIRLKALENLESAGIPTTLVVTVKGGVNDEGLADVVDFALGYACVRGVTFQPVQDAGRNPGFDKKRHRVTLDEIRRQLIDGQEVFGEDDIIPLPCNPEYIAIGYCLRDGRKLTPITSLLPKEEFLGVAPNSIAFEKQPELRSRLFDLLSLSGNPENTPTRLDRLLCCLPYFRVPDELGYEHIFRVTIVQFLDRYNFCLGGVKRSCIHIVHPDGRIIPFDTYNLFYRPDGGSDA